MDKLSVTMKPHFVKWILGGLSSTLEGFSKSNYSRVLIPLYKRFFDVNTEEARIPQKGFDSLEGFFTRKLIQGARPFDDKEKTLVSPVDGILNTYTVDEKAQFKVKGKVYSLADLFKDKSEYENYLKGWVLIFYLSPSNYHRIHMPLAAKEIRSYTRGGFSYPVNDFGLKNFSDVLTKNRRLVSHFENSGSVFTMISLGALNVNSIVRSHDENRFYKKAQEYGYFSFGSTVMLFFPRESIEFSREDGPIKQGETLGKYKAKGSLKKAAFYNRKVKL
ncbi:MAG: phosphatidylserine decarboxylase [Tissierellia bacterium]|jgi:phosphatidylserine decarboxylase|nr:phosphatidylserine decarboxylase [Tissierellia bacterium]